MHVHTDHEKRPLSQKAPLTFDARTSRFVAVPRGVQPHVVLCAWSREPGSRRMFPADVQTIDGHENATGKRPFVVPLVENTVSPEGEPVDKFCMYSRMPSHTMRCVPSHMTICTYHFEVDFPWGRIPMLTLPPAQHPSLSQNQPIGRGSCSRCQSTRWQPRICMNLPHTSTTLEATYQTSQLTLMNFPKWTWTAPCELPLAKNFQMCRP